MNLPEFNWTSLSESEQKEYVEREIYEIIQDNRDNKWPCHPNAIIVSLAISGPLDTRLKGLVKCKKCEKTIMEFAGDDWVSKLKFTIINNL